MFWQTALDIAEQDADGTQDALDAARANHADPDCINTLATEAADARHRFYRTLNADLAL